MGLIPKKTITVRRSQRGENIGGFITPQEPTEFTIRGSVQPVASRDLVNLPEGIHYTSYYWIFTKSYQAEGQDYERDSFLVDEKWCKIVKLENWLNNIINHHPIMVGV